MITINVQQLGVYGRAVRAGCRRDREAYLSHLVDRLSQGPANDIFAAYHQVLGHRRRKPYQPDPLPIIKGADGALCENAPDMHARWRQHFGDLEGGQAVSLDDLASAFLGAGAHLWRSAARPGVHQVCKGPGIRQNPARIMQAFLGRVGASLATAFAEACLARL